MKPGILQSMLKERSHTSGGFSLVEVILASSVFILVVTAFVGAWIYGQEATVLAGNRVQAALLAEEGLEVVRNIRDADFTELTNGTYGLALSGNEWILSGSSDLSGIFTRQVEISSVEADRKKITSTVTWEQNAQRSGVVSLATYLTAWADVQCADQATLLTVDTSAVDLTNANRRLVGITVVNSGVGCGDLVIDKVTVSWTPTTGNRTIEDFLINALSVWSGSATTGTLIEITDTTLASGGSALSTEYRFNNSMNNRVFTIVYTMGDGSVKAISGITP